MTRRARSVNLSNIVITVNDTADVGTRWHLVQPSIDHDMLGVIPNGFERASVNECEIIHFRIHRDCDRVVRLTVSATSQ